MAKGPREDQLSFAEGDLFSTYVELEAKVKACERAQFVKFWKRDARTIEAARKRLDKFLKPELKYYELKYCCIHGGGASF